MLLAPLAFPLMLKTYGFSSGSLLRMVTVAFFAPADVGLKVMSKGSKLPPATLLGGGAVTLNIAASGPVMLMTGAPVRFKTVVPRLWISKVRVTVDTPTVATPKAVRLMPDGKRLLLGMLCGPPTMLMSTDGVLV